MKTSTEVIDPRHQTLIDYRAVNGLIVDDDGMRKLNVDELATMLGVDRRQLYRWQETIPGFWEKVAVRRKTIAPKARLAKVHEVMFLSALKPGADGYRDRVLYLANFDSDFRMPTQEVKHDASGGLADLLEIGRQRALEASNIIEGEVVDETKV